MYIPAHFRENDQATLLEFIERNSFGLLVSQLDGQPFATHLPLLVDRDAAPGAALIGHVARANPQWRSTDRNVLAVFSGPHAYVSPSSLGAAGVVPTWNYVAAHVYGALEVVDDHEATLQIVRAITAFYEAAMPKPWTFDAGDEFIDKMARGVVAFRIAIARIEGKWKLNQNHPRQRRQNVVDALSRRPDEDSQAIAALMAQDLARPDRPDER